MWDHVIENGIIVTTKENYQGNIYIKDGKIAAISQGVLPGEAKEKTDATGLHIFSGFIDTHVHSRDGEKVYKEDFFHSTMSAAAGGITTVFEMPNSTPPISNVENLQRQIEKLTPQAHVDFAIWGLCVGELNNQQIMPLKEAGVIAFKFFWGYALDPATYGLIYNYNPEDKNVLPPLHDGQVLEIFEEVSKTGKVLGVHAENIDLIQHYTRKVNPAEYANEFEALHATRPNICEETVVNTAISFAKATGTKLNILHVSAKESVEAVQKAQEAGLSVTAETCPHYLYLTIDDFMEIGPVMKGYPPVRYPEDQQRIWQGLQDNVFCNVCSDHAPHQAEQKQGSVFTIPAGMCGVESLAPLMIHAVSQGKISMQQLAGVMSENPAKLYGIYPEKGSMLVGTDADFTLVDFTRQFTIETEKLHSISKVTPFDGMKVQGMPVQTIVRGITVAKNGEILSAPIGHFIKG